MKPIIVNTCDAWESYHSFRLVGVYTNKKKFISVIHEMIDEDAIELNEGYSKEDINEDTKLLELQANLKYVHFKEIKLNEKQ